jgi:thiosulfate dehydrogenase
MKSFGKVFFGIVLGFAFLAAAIFLYLKFGRPPVAVADPPFPYERPMVKIPLRARIEREIKTPPFEANEEVLEAGARVYKDECAMCHGTPGQDSGYVHHMFPHPPQLWKKHGSHGVVGVSDDEPGETYWLVANGVRLSGMPSFTNVLSETQMWQVTLLLKNADKELASPVTKILNEPMR